MRTILSYASRFKLMQQRILLHRQLNLDNNLL